MPLAASAWASSARAGALAAAAARLPAAGTARRRPMGAAFSHLLRAASSAPPPEDGLWLVVGLGNPGPRYAATRHNVGFAAVDALAAAAGAPLDRLQHGCAVGRARVGGAKALLAKPQLFMNNSGEGVGKLARFYGVPAERVLVIYDDLDSPLGSVSAAIDVFWRFYYAYSLRLFIALVIRAYFCPPALEFHPPSPAPRIHPRAGARARQGRRGRP
jgi:hypothetical protein